MPRRLMAGQRPLKPSILVRVQAGHHIQASSVQKAANCSIKFTTPTP
jgi:hypothetical protein